MPGPSPNFELRLLTYAVFQNACHLPLCFQYSCLHSACTNRLRLTGPRHQTLSILLDTPHSWEHQSPVHNMSHKTLLLVSSGTSPFTTPIACSLNDAQDWLLHPQRAGVQHGLAAKLQPKLLGSGPPVSSRLELLDPICEAILSEEIAPVLSIELLYHQAASPFLQALMLAMQSNQ